MTKETLKSSIKLAAFDIDGTLLPNGQLEFSDNVSNMFKRLKQANIKSTLATAREFITIGNLMKKTPDLDYFIGGNGAFVFDVQNQKLIYEKTIPLRELKLLYEYFGNDPDTQGFVAMDDQLAYHSPTMDTQTWFFYPHQTKLRLMDFDSIRSDHIHIITLIFTDKDKTNKGAAKAKEIIEKYDLHVEANSQWSKGLFIVPTGVTKSHTLQWLCKYLNLEHSKNLIAFGDSSNDYEMLRDAAYGVAMEKANSWLKAVAKDVAQDCEYDGVCAKLEDLGLIK